ncbi:MAG: undecaprenyl-phosphate glucose phosphotransferase [Pseudomonadota bacterium]
MTAIEQIDGQGEAQPEPTAKPIPLHAITLGVRAVDLVMVGIAGVICDILVMWGTPGREKADYWLAILLGIAMAALCLHMAGNYNAETLTSKAAALRKAITGWIATFAMLITGAFMFKVSSDFSRLWVGAWFISGTAFLIIGRVVSLSILDRLSRAGRFAERTVVIGAGLNGERVVAHLAANGDILTKIVGLIDDRATRVPKSIVDVDLLGGVEDLVKLIRADRVDKVIIALPGNAEERIRHIVHQLSQVPVKILLAPELAAFAFTNRGSSEVGGLSMLQVLDTPISGWGGVLKMLEDRLIAGGVLLMLAPLMLTIALLIKLDSKGPVLFRQKRYGFNNKLIEVFKFRSMYTEMTDWNADQQTTRHDPRVTRIGRLLRKSSLDELPQLLNVLRGEMSIVGPRPHAVGTKAAGRLFEDVVDDYAARHNVKPGLTGWAQVNGWRGETETVDKIIMRVEYDLFYIRNWSIWLDLYIILITPFALMKTDDVY